MKKMNKMMAAALGVCMVCSAFAGCGDGGKKVKSVDICASNVQEYLAAKTSEDQFAALFQGGIADKQVLGITYEHEVGSSYRFFGECIEDGKTCVLTCSQGEVRGGSFVPGKKYRYKIVGMNNEQDGFQDFLDATAWQDSYADYVVQEGSFLVKPNTVRYVTMHRGYNYRDLGGWKTESGKRIAYELIYRGGRTNEFSAIDVATLRDDLGMKSEIDLRNSGDNGGQTQSILGEGFNYLQAPILQYTFILPSFLTSNREYDKNTLPQLKRIFEFLADESNYPLFFHCNAGADRTGTLAFLICGMLGVPMEDLTKDFELTTFSAGGGRYRGKLTLPFEYGIQQDDSGNYVAWGEMIEHIQRDYPAKDGKLSTSIRRYLKETCGISENTLKSIEGILLK